ncbi:PREDICTED: adenylate cyclase type 10-like [Trachymyrmex septentrionalis]|uniref:adenylate cyclase type 10-like n=1 Tax=Trachymyrmex septentrionalis TaxID=34720 RepID=UPI00084F3D40|nr:PREDICTED: adenylate cyclase type 10-like [Trachymyrmex septentrionalis]
MAHNTIDESIVTAWTPDLFGPVFKKKSLTVKQALHLRNVNEQIHRMATFVPDEIIYENLSEKSLRSFRAVLMFLNISGLSKLLNNFIHDKNGGCLALTKTLNDYIDIVVREVYCNEGDILKFSAEGILTAWKVHDGEFIYDVVRNAITSAMSIQHSIVLNDVNDIYKVTVAISAGDVKFSVIGDDEARHFVMCGVPIEELKNAKNISLPNDLILSLSAWQHCQPSQYDYVIKNPYNIKIIKMSKRQSDINSTYMKPKSPNNHDNLNNEPSIDKEFIINDVRPSPYRMSIKEECETEIVNNKEKTSTAITAIAATNPNFIKHLKSYLIKPVILQIEKGESLKFLAEIRRITVISIDIIPNISSDNELILLIDKCFLLLHSIVSPYGGCINTMNLYEKHIFFCIVFGIRGCNNENQFKIDETCKNGLTCAINILQTLKTIVGVQSVFIGISTGIAYCGVIGHIARRYYAIIGPPIDKAIRIMNISSNKVSCDYNTVLHSHFRKDQFYSRGIITLQQLEKCHVFEYFRDEPKQKDIALSLEYGYPILGRLQELEHFNDILDDIGVADRKYSGLLIEGIERSGKSRLLDAFVMSVCNRQIRPIKLSLHATYAEKSYSVIYHIILQILEAEDCETVEEREKELLNKLGYVLALEDFCYLNILMRVRFPLSDSYCSDTDSQRHTKTIDIFKTILKQLKIKICILLDDIQYLDHESWQFLSSALDNYNIVIAMTILKHPSWNNLSHVGAEIYEDKRLMNYNLLGLNVDLLPVFACQFLNVLAIPKKLSRILQRCQDGHLGWCEALLTSILQSNGLNFIKISPSEALQRDLVFPNRVLVTKLPIDLTSVELAPPLSWLEITLLDVCDINENFFEITNRNYDITELRSEIYERMNPYEQDFIKCAATLGKVFKRSMVENVMLNTIPLHTSTAVSEMIRIRILECASLQRRDFYVQDLIYCIDKKRQTFSDMYHSLACNCYHSRAVISRHLPPLHSYCKMLEFKVGAFHKMMYDIQTDEEKQEYHMRAARICELDARKCNSCGSGRFLKILSEDVLKELKKEDIYLKPKISLIRHRTLVTDKWTKPTILPEPAIQTISAEKKRDSVDICRISIMPSDIDDKENGVIFKNGNNDRNILNIIFRRRSSIFPEMTIDPSDPSLLQKFSHIDYRNCQCDNVISHLFWKLREHIENSGEIEKLLEFFIQYSAGMIQIAQPLYAIKLLSIAAKRSKAVKVNELTKDENTKDSITNKGIILALMGDAYNALGNYNQAKKYYLLAVKLRGTLLMEKGICDNIISKMFCKLRDPPYKYTIDEKSKQLVIKKLELASYLRRLCVGFIIENKLKKAESFALRSFKLAFLNVNSFQEKGEIYLATVRVLQCTRNIKLIRRIERLMLITIERKAVWNDAEEITMVANIYLTMYQIRVLRGKLEKAVLIGIKVLKISEALHLRKLTLIIMPSIIQIMLWTRRVNEAVDLMRELYFLADEDTDLSAKTWYYALSLDLILDAGIVLELYETSYNYYVKFIASRSKFCVMRDPQSLCRLLTGLWMYQLRIIHNRGQTVPNAFVCSAEKYVKDITWNDFSRILTCSKGLECYLLLLLHCINTKYSNESQDLVQDISKIRKCLKNISKYARFIKSRLYLLMAYLNVLRGYKSNTQIYLYKARKFAILQQNQLMKAWIMQNKRTWREKIYNNMAQYWLEYIGSRDIVPWQHIRNFNVDTWSTILYPLPLPDAHL